MPDSFTANMKLYRHLVLLGLAAVATGVRAEERELNGWPVSVTHVNAAGQTVAWNSAGPLVFSRSAPEGGTQAGLRPVWVQSTDASGDLRAALFLYPLFSYSADAETYKWSVLQLMNRTGRRAGAPARARSLENLGGFDVWPFWFSRDTGDAATSYRALFPVYGTMLHRLGYDRLSWTLWPLYFQSTTRGATTTAMPWPFVRVTQGAAAGFALWPLFGWQTRAGVSRQEFYLWPLGYNNTTQPAADARSGTPPKREYAILPFYAHASGPGYRGETFVWPLFGYTDRTVPERYHETRYLWPLLVQGRGPEHTVNRWAPFYTYSNLHGFEKTWIAWPLFREVHWTSEGVAQTKTQLLYFFYWSRVQRSPTNPKLPPASITHLWPLVSAWDNGAGQRQWQFPSPLEVFFPGNEKVRAAWTPLFSLVRYDQHAPGHVRTSLLWDGITWERRDAERRTEFHLGPLFSVSASVDERRVAIANGLISWKRDATGTWRLFWLDFPSKPANVAQPPVP